MNFVLRMFDEQVGCERTSVGTLELAEAVPVREVVRRRVLDELARATDTGRLVSRREAQLLDPEAQVRHALEAFDRQGYFVFVGQRQVESLDELVDVACDGDITFVRLVQLVGG